MEKGKGKGKGKGKARAEDAMDVDAPAHASGEELEEINGPIPSDPSSDDDSSSSSSSDNESSAKLANQNGRPKSKAGSGSKVGSSLSQADQAALEDKRMRFRKLWMGKMVSAFGEDLDVVRKVSLLWK